MKRWIAVFAFIVLAGVMPQLVSANGVVRTGNCIGAEQCGAGISGIATATDASVAYANPAGLAEQRGARNSWRVDVGFDALYPRYRFAPQKDADVNSERHLLVLPLGMVSADVTPYLRLGFFTHVPYGLRTDWATDSRVVFFEQRGKISLRGDGVAIGLRLLDSKLLLGGSVFYADVDIDTASATPLHNPIVFDRQTIKTDGGGWGGTLGLRWHPSRYLTLGFTYRSPIRAETSGLSHQQTGFRQTVRTDFTFPESWGVGAAYWLIPRQIRVVGEWTYFKQSRADDLFLKFGSGTITHVKLDWRDTQAYQLGLEWIVNPTLVWRAGGGWVGAAIPKATVSPTFFDAPGWDVATGITAKLGERTTLSAFFMYVWAPTRTVQLGEGTSPGEYRARIPQFGLSISRTF